MNEIKIQTGHTILEALYSTFRDEYLLNRHIKEYRDLLREYVYLFTQEKSSSISKENYETIIHALDYIFFHTSYDEKMSLKWNLYQGRIQIQKDVKMIQNYLPLYQDYFWFKEINDLIGQDLPANLKCWIKPENWLYFSKMKRDFTYPLIGEYTSMQENQALKGTDFAIDYLKRFDLEMKLCSTFKEEISDFLTSYRISKGIALEELNVNLSELFFYHAFASFLVSSKRSLLLDFRQIERIKRVINHLDLEKQFNFFFSTFDQEVLEYFSRFKRNLLDSFLRNIHHLIIYQKRLEEERWMIKEYGSVEDLGPLFNEIYKISVDQLPDLFQKYDLGIYDLMDVLDQLCFSKEEYQKLFSGLGKDNCKMIKTVLYKVYHGMPLEELYDENEWIEELDLFLRTGTRFTMA